jgi:hypothetical protein
MPSPTGMQISDTQGHRLSRTSSARAAFRQAAEAAPAHDRRGLRGYSVRLPGHDLDHPDPPIAQRVVGIAPLVPQAVAD